MLTTPQNATELEAGQGDADVAGAVVVVAVVVVAVVLLVAMFAPLMQSFFIEKH